MTYILSLGRYRRFIYVPTLVCLLVLGGCVHVVEGDGMPEPLSDEDIARTSVELGLAHLRNGDRISAKRPLLHALEVNPQSPHAHHALAILYAGDLEYQLADAHYQKALGYDPNFTQARNNYGAFLHAQERNAEAVMHLEQAAADTLYPRRAQIFENLARAYLGLQNTVMAESAFLRALNMEPKLLRSHLELADIYFNLGRLEEAYHHFKRYDALKRQPTARALWLGLRMERVLENRDAVASYALLLRSMFPASEEYRLYRESID